MCATRYIIRDKKWEIWNIFKDFSPNKSLLDTRLTRTSPDHSGRQEFTKGMGKRALRSQLSMGSVVLAETVARSPNCGFAHASDRER